MSVQAPALVNVHVERIVSTLEGVDAATLDALADACGMADGRLAWLRTPLQSLAINRERDEGPNWVTRSQLVAVLELLVHDEPLVAELTALTGPPFSAAVADALVAIRR